jgi:hypothetical protein
VVHQLRLEVLAVQVVLVHLDPKEYKVKHFVILLPLLILVVGDPGGDTSYRLKN